MKIEGFSVSLNNFLPIEDPFFDLANVADLIVCLCEAENKRLSFLTIKIHLGNNCYCNLVPHLWADKLSIKEKTEVIYRYFVAEKERWDSEHTEDHA